MDPDQNRLNETLEQLIDDEGLLNVMLAAAEVCRLKAEHIRDNWQDKVLARRWDTAAKKLEGMQAVLSATDGPPPRQRVRRRKDDDAPL